MIYTYYYNNQIMIDILYTKLQSIDDVALVEWKDFDTTIFSKHVQYYKDLHQELPTVIAVKEEIPIVPLLLEKKKDITAKKDIIGKKDITGRPLDIINRETISFNNSTEYIKEKLITLISKDEFSKIFGITKCAEIMSGIVNNRWNKSTAIFISFLLDKEVYYNDKLIIYNKEKNNGRITIAKG